MSTQNYIYVYDGKSDDFTSFGLVGALTPKDCTFEEEANGMSEVTLEHPLDALGKYRALENGNVLSVPVPVRTTVGVIAEKEAYTPQIMKVKAGLVKDDRKIYQKNVGTKRIGILTTGDECIVCGFYAKTGSKDEDRYKVATRVGTGWIKPESLEDATPIDETGGSSIDEVLPTWSVMPQLFRIYSVEKKLDSVKVSAQHISYDLLTNLTDWDNVAKKKDDGSDLLTSLQDAADAVLEHTYYPNEFEAFTDIADTRAGLDYRRKNPVEAFLDPETGITARFNAQLVRNNYELYFLHEAGVNRGIRIEYGKNMVGIKFSEKTDEVATRLVPTGEDKDGNDILLTTPYKDKDGGYTESHYPHDYVDAIVDGVDYNDVYPIPHVYTFKAEDCKVEKNTKEEFDRIKESMIDQCNQKIEDGCYLPPVEMSVEFIDIGDSEQYRHLRGLERLFLYDYVSVYHPKQSIDKTARVTKIKWNVLAQRMKSVEIGEIGETLANATVKTWQIPSGFSGAKIAAGTVGAGALGNDIINARHIQAESINADALQAHIITSDHISTYGLSADVIDVDTITAESAFMNKISAQDINAIAQHVNNLAANNISTDIFSAAIMRVASMAATNANIVNAVVSNLTLKGSDGVYYRVFIDNDGTITTVPVEASTDAVSTVNSSTLENRNVFNSDGLGLVLGDAVKAEAITQDQAAVAVQVIPVLKTTLIQSLQGSIYLEAADNIMFYTGGAANGIQRWMKFDSANGLEMRMPMAESGKESNWFTRMTNDSFDICNKEVGHDIAGSHNAVATFKKFGMIADEITLGKIRAKRTGKGGWAFNVISEVDG